MTHEVMLNPFLGTDHTSYERESIRRWIELHHKFSLTREPMKMHCIMPDYTMRRILSALEDHKITEDFIDHIKKNLFRYQ